jgi:thioesterase domain-containing protein
MVAYEMASELTRNNESVAMVFMVDTYPWFPKALTNCSEYITKCVELNLKILEMHVVNNITASVKYLTIDVLT